MEWNLNSVYSGASSDSDDAALTKVLSNTSEREYAE